MAIKMRSKLVTMPAKPKPPKISDEGLHAHRCPRCQERYEDRCGVVAADPVCSNCVYGTTWAIWRTNRLPQACCIEHRQIATKDEIVAHRLGGSSTWWICSRCKRTHPYEPKERQR